MPDTINRTNYNRADDFLNNGYANINPSPAAPNFPPAGEQETATPPSALDVFTSIGQNLKQTATEQNPFISSLQYTTPYKTPLDQTIKYNSPKYGFNPFNPELEHDYAARQSWFDAWKNNVLKFGAQAGGTLLETVTAIPQVLNGLEKGDLNKVYNNPLSNSIQEWTNGLEETLPNYKSAFEDEHPILSYIPGFASLKTLGDKWGGVFKTLGFVAGTVGGTVLQDALVGAATEGVGELPLFEPQLQSFMGKMGKIFASPDGAVKVADAVKNGANVADAIDGVYNTVKNADRFRYNLSLFTSATGSSMIFANGMYNDMKSQLSKEFYQQHGRDPQNGDIDRIESIATNAGNADMLANTALQMKVFDNVFSTVFKSAPIAIRDVENQVTNRVNVGLQAGSQDVFEQIAPSGKFQFLKKIAEPNKIGGTLLNTTYEMAGLYGIQRSAEDFAQRKFNDDSINDTDNFMRSLATGINDTFTTSQGLENVLIGVLGGALIHGAKLGIDSYKGVNVDNDAVGKSVVALLNSSKVSDLFQHTYDETVTADSITNSMKKAAEQGDAFEYENLKHQQLFNFISSGVKAGKFDLRLQQLESMKDLKGSDFQKMFGLDFNDTNKNNVADYVDSVIAKSKDIKTDIDKVDTIFKNPFKQSDRKNYIAFEEYKNQLALDLSDMRNNKGRIQSLSSDISKLAPTLDQDKLVDLTHEIGIEQTVKRLEDRVKEIDDTTKITDKASDESKQDQVEKTFLQGKIDTFKKALQTGVSPDINETGELLNYYANGNKVSNNFPIHPIDLIDITKKAQDKFKLENMNNRAMFHYQQLTGKKGFNDYIADVLAKNNVNYQRYINALKDTLTNPKAGEVKPVSSDIVDIDENGNPLTPASTEEVKPKPEVAKKGKGKKAAPVEETEAEKKEAEKARKDYEAKKAEVDKLNQKKKELETILSPTPEGTTPVQISDEAKLNAEKELTDVNKQLAVSQPQLTDLEKTQPVVLSTTKADEAVDISEIEDPQNEANKKVAVDQKQATVKNSIFKSFDPFKYVNQLFSRDFEDSKEHENLKNALFSNSPQKLYNKIQLNVSRSTKGKKPGTYSKIQKEGVNIYRNGYTHDIDMVVDGDVIGKIQPGDSLFYKVGDEYKPLVDVSQEDYEKVTGNDPTTYNEFIDQLKAYQEITDTILRSHLESGKKTFSNDEVQKLLNIVVRYGNVNYAKSSGSATPLSDLNYKTNGDFVVSFPSEFNSQTGKMERTSEPNIINEHELNTEDQPKAWEFINNNIEQLKRADSRYIYVTKLPNGKYESVSALNARPKEADPTVIEGLLTRVSKINDTTNKADLRKLNHDLRNQIFISDTNNRKGSGTTLSLSVNEQGKVYINVFNKYSDFRRGYFLPDIRDAKTTEDLATQINNQLSRKAAEDSGLAKLNLNIDAKDFKTSMPNDEKMDIKDMRSKLSVVAPHADIFDNYGLHVIPLKSKASEGFQPLDKKLLEPEQQEVIDTVKENINDLAPALKESIEALANGGVKDQQKLAETVASVVENDPEGAKEVLGEKVVEKTQQNTKAKPAKKRIVAKKKTPVEQAVASAGDINETYRKAFTDNPEQGLKELADQLHDPKSEEIARKTFGDTISNIALKLHPKQENVEQNQEVVAKAAEEKSGTPEVQKQGVEASKVQSEKSVKDLSPKEYADRLAKMTEEERDNVDFDENSKGYNLYIAREIMPKKANSLKFKKLSEDDAPLNFEYDYVANVDGIPYGLTKQEDPDNPDDEKAFVWSYHRLDGNYPDHETSTSNNAEVIEEIKSTSGEGEVVKEKPKEEISLDEAIEQQIAEMQKPKEVPVLKAKTEDEINRDYSEQLDKLNSSMEQLIEKREKLLDEEKPTDEQKADIAEYGRRIKDLENQVSDLQDERDKDLEAAQPKEVEVGDKALYQGKEVLVTDKEDSGNGDPVYTVSDGGQGESVVYNDKLLPIDETLGEPTDLPTAIDKRIEPGDKVWFNGKLYNVLGNDEGKLILEDPETSQVYPNKVLKESTIPHNEQAEHNYLIDYVGLRQILDRLKERFGINYSVVSDPEGKWKGRFKDGMVYINKDYVDRTTPFHEYLHPLIKVLEVDNPELYNNLLGEYKNLVDEGIDDYAVEANAEVQRSYKDSTEVEQQQEGLVRYISKLSSKNVTKEGEKESSQLMRAMKSLLAKFSKWLGDVWKYVKGIPVNKIPTDATLQDLADIVSLTDYSIDLKSRMDLVGKMDSFQKKSDQFNDEIFERLNRNLDKFTKTAARLRSEELSSEAASIRRIFETKTEAESLSAFVYQGLRGLGWASDEFSRITGKLKNTEVKLDQQEIRQLNNSLSNVKQMLAFYKDDVNELFSRIANRKEMDDETYRTYAETLRDANITASKIQTRSVDLMTEWLYPAIEHTNELIREKYPDYVLSKDDFRKQLYNATGDVDRLFFALGSVGSSKDPVSGIVSNVIKETVEDSHRYDAVLSHIMKTAYDEFLKEHGLPNERGKTGDFYKDKYLRKASVLEKVGEDENGEPKYDYVDRWAFHQPYFFDKWTKDYEAYINSLKEVPQSIEWTNKLHEWQDTHGTINEPSKEYLNPDFHNLYGNDKMFTTMYDIYKEGNEHLQAEEQLPYGMIPQVSKGKNMFSDLTWSKYGAMNVLRKVGQFLVPRVEEGNEYDVNLTNMDGSMYKRIKVAYVRPLEESDLDFALPETVFKFAGVANMAREMRDLEPNVRTLKSLLDGDSEFITKARGVVNTIKKSKGGKAETAVNTILSSKKAQRTTLVNKQLSAFIDDVVYGDNEMKDTIKTPLGQIDLNQWGNNMSFLTALNNMAFNITAGISNVVIGDIQGFGEAVGGKYYKRENYLKAQKQYWSSIIDFTRDVTELKKSMITQLGVKYDAIQGEFRDKYGKRFVGNVMQKYASPDSLFIFNHAGEHHIQLTGMLALMDATKVKTTDGRTISLFDAHELTPNGYLKLRDGVQWTTQDDNDFTKRLHSLNKMLNGNYSKFDKAYIQRKWYGKLALVYRKYLYNAFRQRYGKQRVDYELQDVYEGYYRTFFTKLGKDIMAYKFEAANRFLTRKGWSADEKYAYNKTMYEISLFTGITMMGIALGATQTDKQKSAASWGQNYLTLLMLRANNDISQYSMFGINDMARIMQNPSAVMQSLSRYGQFFQQLVSQPFATYKRKTGAFARGESVLKAKAMKAIPIVRQYINILSPAEQQKFYNLTGTNNIK